jgi:hypothetical protein
VTGTNHAPLAQVFDGITGLSLGPAQLLGDNDNESGVHVATGDIDGDGEVEILTSQERLDTRIKVWRLDNGVLALQNTIETPFVAQNALSGVRVSTGDLDGDLTDEIIVSPGTGRTPEVYILDAEGARVSHIALPADLGLGGLTTATGDLSGDGIDDLVIAGGVRSDSQVFIALGKDTYELNQTLEKSVSLYTKKNSEAALSIALKDIDGDRELELFSAQSSDGRSAEISQWDWTEDADEFFSKIGSIPTNDDLSGDLLG